MTSSLLLAQHRPETPSGRDIITSEEEEEEGLKGLCSLATFRETIRRRRKWVGGILSCRL